MRATLLNSKKTREDALYRGITTKTQSAQTANGAATPRVHILLASGGAKRRAERIVMHESCADLPAPTRIRTTDNNHFHYLKIQLSSRLPSA